MRTLDRIKRSSKLWWQRKTRGWDDSDTWSLDHTIAKFALPRLKKFKELNIGYPNDMTWEEWNVILDEMYYALECVASLEFTEDEGKIDWNRVETGLQYFGKYFRDLWW